jgi:hypothetical protein
MGKNLEAQHKKGSRNPKDYKLRFLVVPNFRWRAPGSQIGQHLLNFFQGQTDLGRAFAIRKNPDILAEELTKAWNRIKDPILITWDGAQHDSHQNNGVRAVDWKMIDLFLDKVCMDCGYTLREIREIRRMAKKTYYKFVINYNEGQFKRAGIKLASGEIHNGVPSGDPLQTTLGNTNRVVLFILYICHLAGIQTQVDNAVDFDAYVQAAGDDVLVILSKALLAAFREALAKVYTTEKGVEHGLGLLLSDYTESETKGNFLGREIVVELGQIKMNRPISRIYNTAVATDRDPAVINDCVVQGLKSNKSLVYRTFANFRRTFYPEIPKVNRNKAYYRGIKEEYERYQAFVGKDYEVERICPGKEERLYLAAQGDMTLLGQLIV